MIKNETRHDFYKRLTRPNHRMPLYGQWELTYRCNLRCVMCYTECFDKPEFLKHELTLPEIFRIINELAAAGVFHLTLTGGEPLAHAHFKEIYEHIYKSGISITLYSNGTLITGEMASFFGKLKPEMIEVSMHGIEGEFDAITGIKKSWDRCLRGIRHLRDNKVPLTLKTVGMTLNKDFVLKIKKWVGEMEGVLWYLGEEMRPELNGSKEPLQYQLSQKDFGEIASQDSELWKEHLQITEMLSKEKKEEIENVGDNRCGSSHKFHIDPYGGMQLCSGNRERTFDLRNNSFSDGF